MNTLFYMLDDFTWDKFGEICEAITSIDTENIEGELEKQSACYAYYFALLGKAKTVMNKAKADLEALKAVKANDFRNEYTAQNSKKPTDKITEYYVLANPDVGNLTNDLLEKEERYELVKSIVRSLEQKSQMIVQISSNRRAEVKLYN